MTDEELPELLRKVNRARAESLDDARTEAIARQHARGRWSARAWIKNIANDTHITGGLRTAFTDAFAVTDPRAFGGSFRYNFGAL